MKKKPEHTPGPWEITENNNEGINLAIEAHGGVLASIGPFGVPDEEDRANARLIAAAPELLSFIQQIADGQCNCILADDGETEIQTCEPCKAIRLISKAERG